MEAEVAHKLKIEETHMETKHGFKMPEPEAIDCQPPTGKTTFIGWGGEWTSFRKRFKAAANLNGVRDALKAGELSASDEETKIDAGLQKKATLQSERLAALLILSLEPTKGPQRSIVVNTSVEEEEDGVLMWARLVRHFEKSTREIRLAALLQEWEGETLGVEEHPDELHGRLVAMNSKLASLGEGYSEAKLLTRFVSAIERSGDARYASAIQQYRGAVIQGNPYSLEKLREFLSYVYATPSTRAEPTLKGLVTTPQCTHCGKPGHVEDDCWTKDPARRTNGRKAVRKRTCWECGKEGHIAKECPKKERNIRKSIVAANMLEDKNKEITFIDSACSVHLVESLDTLYTVRKLHRVQTMQTVDGHTISLTHKGEREITTNQGTLKLGTVYYAKGIKFRLVSVSELARNGVRTVFEPHRAYIETGNTRIVLGRDTGLWTIPEIREARVAALRMGLGGVTDSETWHWRMGHPSAQKTAKMIEQNIVPNTVRPEDASSCAVCNITNPKRRPVPTTAERSGLATVQADYMPMGHDETGWKGEVGAYIFSDRSSKIVQAYPVTNASANTAIRILEHYLTYIVSKLTNKVECIQTDAGSQFTTGEWARTCEKRGLRSRTCPVDHQAMNGQVERVQGTLSNLMRAMMKTTHVPRVYWPLALENAAYLFNRTPHTSLGYRTPLEVGTNETLDTSNIRVFGCKAYVQTPKIQRRGKLADTAWEGAMVGFSTNSPEWLILDRKTRNVRKAYSVTFQERISGFDNMHGTTDDNTETTAPVYMEESYAYPLTAARKDKHSTAGENCTPKDEARTTQPATSELSEDIERRVSDADNDTAWEKASDEGPNSQVDQGVRRSTRTRQQVNPNYMPSGTREMEALTRQIEADSSASDDEGSSPSTGEPGQLVDLEPCMALQVAEGSVPRSWRQATHIPQWLDAMKAEKRELEGKGAWELVPTPQGKAVLPGLWRFKVKRDENGDIAKYKARWCVDGSREGFVRLPETKYSPVSELSTIRIIFAVAAAKGQKVLQADFPNAYLNAEIQEEVYVCQPRGLEAADKLDHVCLLRKALYGTSISGRLWHEKITTVVKGLGYQQSKIDHCLFYRTKQEFKEILTIYVDDVLVTSSGGTERAETQLRELSEIFSIKMLGVATHMLGMRVSQKVGTTTVDQRAYLEDILEEADFVDAKPRSTPWDAHLICNEEPLGSAQTQLYRRLVGQLMYLSTVTRPDIAFVVGRLASGVSKPTKGLWERVKRVLRYLNGSKDAHIKYTGHQETLAIETYVDTSYASDPVRRRSITGYVINLGGGPVIWRSHLQSTVVDSPNAAEYVGLYEAAVASMGIKNLLEELGMNPSTPLIYEDNDGARRLAMSGMGQKRARHLDIKHHLVQDLCRDGQVEVVRLPGEDQPADLLTKGSHTAKAFTYLREGLGVVMNT